MRGCPKVWTLGRCMKKYERHTTQLLGKASKVGRRVGVTAEREQLTQKGIKGRVRVVVSKATHVSSICRRQVLLLGVGEFFAQEKSTKRRNNGSSVTTTTVLKRACGRQGSRLHLDRRLGAHVAEKLTENDRWLAIEILNSIRGTNCSHHYAPLHGKSLLMDCG